MEINCGDFCAHEKDCSWCKSPCEKQMIMMMFCSLGELNLKITENGRSSEYRMLPHTYGIHYSRHGQYSLKYPHCKRIQILQIIFPSKFLLYLLNQNNISSKPQQFLKDREILNRIRPITPIMHLIINQIQEPSLHGDTCYLFFTAKILDLINCILNTEHKEVEQPVNQFDLEHIKKAQAILKTNLEDPPSVNELAGRIGVSPAKLKQIFPKICGMPPYCYLRKLRMEKAMHLLNNEKMNVTETAYDVGYSSLSHFSNVFTKCFGMKPSEARNLPRISKLSDI